MNVDGSVIIDTTIDTSGVEKGVKSIKPAVEKATGSVDSLGDEFAKTGKQGVKATREIHGGLSDIQSAIGSLATTIGLSFGLDSLIDFGSQAVSLASDLQEVQNVVDTAFGDMAVQVDQFASTAIEKFGMSELAAKQTAGRYMAMTTAMGITGQAAANMAMEITGLTGDMSSFYNVSQDVAATALASIWTGETESLKQFGIVMTQANLEQFALQNGIKKTWNELTQAEQVQLRYNYVLEQTSLAQGDFAKTADSWANQQRILEERTKALSAEIGEGLMESLTPLLEIINDIVGALSSFQESTGLLDDFFLAIIGGIAGLTAVKAIDIIKGIAASIALAGNEALVANLKMGALGIIFGLLATLALKLASAWENLDGAQKVVAVLGLITAAAFTAAIAVGAFQSALTLGIAAAAIVTGIAAVAMAIGAAQKQAEQSTKAIQDFDVEAYNKSMGRSSTSGNAAYARIMAAQGSIPGLATGAVIPPNRQFVAVLGDQTNGRNLEGPESLFRKIVREESGSGRNMTFTLRVVPSGAGMRAFKFELDEECKRQGMSLVGN